MTWLSTFMLIVFASDFTCTFMAVRQPRQIYYPDRPMIYINPSPPPPSLSPSAPASSSQFTDPDDIFTTLQELQRLPSTTTTPKPPVKSATPELILLAMPVGVPLSLLPPPTGPIQTPSNNIIPQFAARGHPSSNLLFGARNRPMMQSASFSRLAPRIRPHGINLQQQQHNFKQQMAETFPTMLHDFPMYSEVPQTSFRCSEHQYPGYYGDVEAKCQVVHVCQSDGRHDSFLCPNGTIFNQQYFVCDWWFNVECSRTPMLYSLNSQLYASE